MLIVYYYIFIKKSRDFSFYECFNKNDVSFVGYE